MLEKVQKEIDEMAKEIEYAMNETKKMCGLTVAPEALAGFLYRKGYRKEEIVEKEITGKVCKIKIVYSFNFESGLYEENFYCGSCGNYTEIQHSYCPICGAKYCGFEKAIYEKGQEPKNIVKKIIGLNDKSENEDIIKTLLDKLSRQED